MGGRCCRAFSVIIRVHNPVLDQKTPFYMSRLKSWLTAGIILVAAGAIFYLMIAFAPEATQTEPPPQIPFAQTALVTAGTGPIPVYGAGTVRPTAEIDISPQVSGRVDSVSSNFRSGGRVAAGQPLFWIEPDDYRYQVEEAEANLASRRVALLEERQRAAIARMQYERYSAGQTDPADNSLALREPQLYAAVAAVRRDSAKLASAQLALMRTVVTAPFNGFVREEHIDIGQIVAAGQPVGQLFASDAVEVVVALSDVDASLIPDLWAPNKRTSVTAIVSFQHGDRTVSRTGHVDRAEAFLDAQTRTIAVVIRVPNPYSTDAPPLLVGEFVQVEIEGMNVDDHYRLPRAALQPENEVWVVNDGTIQIVQVQVLQRAEDFVHVTGPLSSDAVVITGGLQYGVEGMSVQTETDG